MGIDSFNEYVNTLWNRKTLREAHICKNDSAMYTCLLDKTSFLHNPVIRQRLWHILNNNLSQVLCPVCKNENKWNADQKSYHTYCSTKCSAIGTKSVREYTSLAKYGVTHYSKTSKFADDIKTTSLKRYGVTHYSKSSEYTVSKTSTNLAKFGAAHPAQSLLIQGKIRDAHINKYGVSHPWELPIIRDKIKATFIEKYGTPYPQSTLLIKEKVKSSNLSKYGNITFTGSHEYKEKYTTTCLEKYGVPYSSQAHLSEFCLSNYNNVQWLACQHHTLKKPVYIIAAELGVSSSHLCKIFHQHNIDILHFFKSQAEVEIYNYIRSISADIGIRINDRKAIYPHELDIYIPSINLAIEHCGIFYHSESKVGKYYHVNKLEKCEQVGIRLIQVFENEWKHSANIVKGLISDALSVYTSVAVEQCIISDIDCDVADSFYATNYILSASVSTINIGIIYKNDILACMSFKHIVDNNYELLQYATRIGHRVDNGHQVLFNAFIKQYSPDTVISSCNRRVLNTEMHVSLGFKHTNTTLPTHYYFHRSNTLLLLKSIPACNTSTEWANMTNSDYNRIWDCGYKVLVWTK